MTKALRHLVQVSQSIRESHGDHVLTNGSVCSKETGKPILKKEILEYKSIIIGIQTPPSGFHSKAAQAGESVSFKMESTSLADGAYAVRCSGG